MAVTATLHGTEADGKWNPAKIKSILLFYHDLNSYIRNKCQKGTKSCNISKYFAIINIFIKKSNFVFSMMSCVMIGWMKIFQNVMWFRLSQRPRALIFKVIFYSWVFNTISKNAWLSAHFKTTGGKDHEKLVNFILMT